MDEHCRAMINVGRVFGTRPCWNRAVRDGYCAIHHPDAVQRRADKANAATQVAALSARVAELEAENARMREALERIAMPGVEELTVAERIAVFPTAWQCIKCARAALSVQP